MEDRQAELIAISFADRRDLTYASDQEVEKAEVQFVSGWMFDSFGLRPALGRMFTENDDRTPGAHQVAVLSRGLLELVMLWTGPQADRAHLQNGRRSL